MHLNLLCLYVVSSNQLVVILDTLSKAMGEMEMHSVGFIGLGNVGGKLAGSLLRNKCDVMVRDLDRDLAAPFLEDGAKLPRVMANK